MAEICLDCWNKLNGENCDEWDYVLSRDLELCEECGEWKRVIIKERFSELLYDMPRGFELFSVLFILLVWIIKLMIKAIQRLLRLIKKERHPTKKRDQA